MPHPVLLVLTDGEPLAEESLLGEAELLGSDALGHAEVEGNGEADADRDALAEAEALAEEELLPLDEALADAEVLPGAETLTVALPEELAEMDAGDDANAETDTGVTQRSVSLLKMNPRDALHRGVPAIAVHPMPAMGAGHHGDPLPLPHTLALSAAGLPALTRVAAPSDATVKAFSRAHRAGASARHRSCAASHRRAPEHSVAAATNTGTVRRDGLAAALRDACDLVARTVTVLDAEAAAVAAALLEPGGEAVPEKLTERAGCAVALASRGDADALALLEDDVELLGDTRTLALGLTAVDTEPVLLPVARAEALDVVDMEGDGDGDGALDANGVTELGGVGVVVAEDTGEPSAVGLGHAVAEADRDGECDALAEREGDADGLGERDGRTVLTCAAAKGACRGRGGRARPCARVPERTPQPPCSPIASRMLSTFETRTRSAWTCGRTSRTAKHVQ